MLRVCRTDDQSLELREVRERHGHPEEHLLDELDRAVCHRGLHGLERERPHATLVVEDPQHFREVAREHRLGDIGEAVGPQHAPDLAQGGTHELRRAQSDRGGFWYRKGAKGAKMREALAALDAAIAALGATVEMLARYDLAGEKLPLSDSELLELIELRDQVWQPRTVQTLTPPNPPETWDASQPVTHEYAASWARLYEVHPARLRYRARPVPSWPDRYQ